MHTSILHISDLHRNVENEDDQTLVMRAFLDDVRRQRDAGIIFDVILFSGDIVRRAQDADDYLTAASDVIDILTAADLPDTSIVFCPGNHDANRLIVDERSGSLETFRKAAQSRDAFNKVSASDEFKSYCGAVFENYAGFVDLHNTSLRVHQSAATETRLFPSSMLAVISINTASLSSAGNGQLPDRHNLAIGEHELRHALSAATDGFRKIVVGHHPLDWLTDEARVMAEEVLAANQAHYFHGHMHDVNPKKINSIAGSALFMQAGALFCGRNANHYSICLVDESHEHAWVKVRSYYDRRGQFDIGTDRTPGGDYFSSSKARSIFNRVDPTMTLSKWKRTALQTFLAQLSQDTLGLGNLSDIFVEPDFEKDAPLRKDAPIRMGSETVLVTFNELISSSTNYIIAAASESGKTSLLLEWAMREAVRDIEEHPRIPTYLQFSEVPPYKARYLPFIKSRLPDLPGDVHVPSLLEAGDVLFFVDDVDFHDPVGLNRLKSFLAEYPACRYVVTTGTSLLASPGVQPMIGEQVKFEAVRLKSLRIGQLRKLAERFGITDRAKNERIIARLYDEMKALAVPITPVTTTFLLRIYTDDENVTFVNRATLVERFIELLLDRYAFQELIPGAFDFVNKTHVLGFIAEKMVRLSNYAPDASVIRSWIAEYLLDLGLGYSSDKILEYLVSARVLKRVGDTVSFKLKAFFAYFCALRMSRDPNFKGYILAEERYLSFSEEIGFFSAIDRDDLETLEILKKRFEDTRSSSLFSNAAKANVAALRTFQLPEEKEPGAFLKNIEKQIFAEPLPADERDAILYDSDIECSEADQIVTRADLDPESRPFAQLQLISSVLRHMDLIPDRLKRETLTELLDGWNEFLVRSLAIVPGLLSKQKMTLEGVEYRLNLPAGTKPEVMTRNLLLAMPIAVARFAFYRLGSEKLLPQIVGGIGDAKEPVERQLIRFCIAADIGARGLARLVQKLQQQLLPFRYLTNVLLTKLNETLLRLQYEEKEAAALRSSAADILIHMSGRKKINKGTLVGRLARQELTLRIRAGRSENNPGPDGDDGGGPVITSAG